MLGSNRRTSFLALVLLAGLLFSAYAPPAEPARLSLTDAEKQEWASFIAGRFVPSLPEFTRKTDSANLDLTAYLFRYLWENKDSKTLAPFEPAIWRAPASPGPLEIMALPLAEMERASVYLLNRTPAMFSESAVFAVQADRLLVFPHGLEDFPLLPRILACTALGTALTFRVEFYSDEYNFDGFVMHGADGTALTHDQFLARLPDTNFAFAEAPSLTRLITVERVEDAAGDRYVIVENIESGRPTGAAD